MVKAAVICLGVGAALLAITYWTDPVKLEVRPRMLLSPGTIVLTVTGEPKETNRGLTIRIDSENYYRSSIDPDWTGLESPKIRNYRYELRDPGHYEISVILHRADPDKDAISSVPLCFAGADVEC